jgi:hypothetical protein
MSLNPRLQPLDRSKFGRLVLGCLMAALVLVLSPAAFATTLVPMCGERGETIAAPPPMRASSDSAISDPCSTPFELASDPAAPSRSPEAVPAELVPRMPPVYYRLPRSAPPVRLLHGDAFGSARPAFTRGIDRPPR